MHVVNAMFSRGLGGIEQSFVDYCACLKNKGHKVTAIIHPDAEVRSALVGIQVNIINVNNSGIFDFLAKSYLKKVLMQIKPDVIIAHGNRAACLLKAPAKKISCPLVGVTHNYKLKRQVGLDAMFATTEDLKNHLIELGQKESSIYKVPNMIKTPESAVYVKEFRSPPVIGTMGRFVVKKGFDYYIRAIAEMKHRNLDFDAVIGGSGPCENDLKQLAQDLNVLDSLKFLGWVENKSKFFDSIDIFVLPSLHEPFGIILLEAFSRGKVVITTDSEGPFEISTDGRDALIIEMGSSNMIANTVERLMNDRGLAKKLAHNAILRAKDFDLDKVGQVMSDALIEIVKRYK